MSDSLAAFVVISIFPFVVFVWALCRIAAKPTPKVSTIGRRSYAEGRPTMPSEVEPESETERRTR